MELLDRLEKEVLLVAVVFLVLTDHQDRKVKRVIEDLLAQMDQKAKLEILVVLDPLVCKGFVVFQAAQVHQGNLVVLANVVCPVLMEKTANKVLRVFKVCLDLLVFQESVVLRERTAKTVILDLLANLDLAVIPGRMEQLVHLDLQDHLVLTANVVLLALLERVASKAYLALPAHLETLAKTANLVCRDPQDFLAQVGPEESAVSLESVGPLAPQVHPVSVDLLA